MSDEITREQLIESIKVLRARRDSIAELRDYRPQSRGKSPRPERSVEEVFGGLLSRGEEGGDT